MRAAGGVVVKHRRRPRQVLARKTRTASSGAAGMEAAFTAETVLADLDAFTCTSPGLPYKVRVFIPLVSCTTLNNGVQARLREITGLVAPTANQGDVRALCPVEVPRAGGGGHVLLEWNVENDAEGVQRTFRATGARTGAGTGTCTANADAGTVIGKAFIEQVVE